MKPHFQYASYVARHKWFVFRAGLKTKAPIWRLLIHDWSKLTPSEWFPYVDRFYGGYKNDLQFNAAWLHHQHRNPHHWQHWVLREDDGDTFPISMPYQLVREMVADWMGAGRAITGKWEVWNWYEENKDRMVLHSETRRSVEQLISEIRAVSDE